MHASCEALIDHSADAIDAVNAYVDAFNEDAADVDATEGPAVDALNHSADLVAGSITDALPPDLTDALDRWVDAARAAADGDRRQAAGRTSSTPPSPTERLQDHRTGPMRRDLLMKRPRGE